MESFLARFVTARSSLLLRGFILGTSQDRRVLNLICPKLHFLSMGDRDQHGRIKDVGYHCMVLKSG